MEGGGGAALSASTPPGLGAPRGRGRPPPGLGSPPASPASPPQPPRRAAARSRSPSPRRGGGGAGGGGWAGGGDGAEAAVISRGRAALVLAQGALGPPPPRVPTSEDRRDEASGDPLPLLMYGPVLAFAPYWLSLICGVAVLWKTVGPRLAGGAGLGAGLAGVRPPTGANARAAAAAAVAPTGADHVCGEPLKAERAAASRALDFGSEPLLEGEYELGVRGAAAKAPATCDAPGAASSGVPPAALERDLVKLQEFVRTLSASLEAAEASAAKRKRDFETIVRRAAEHERVNEARMVELQGEVVRRMAAEAEALRAAEVERERYAAAELRAADDSKRLAADAASSSSLRAEAVQRRLKESIEENVRLKNGQRAFNRSIETGIRKVLLSYKVAMRWRLKVAASKTRAAAAGAGAGQQRFLEAEGVFRDLAAKQERARRGLEAEVAALKGDLGAAVRSKAELLQEQEVWEKDTTARVKELQGVVVRLETDLAAAREQGVPEKESEGLRDMVALLEVELAAAKDRESVATEAAQQAAQEGKETLAIQHEEEMAELRQAVEKGLRDAEEEVRSAAEREEKLILELQAVRAAASESHEGEEGRRVAEAGAAAPAPGVDQACGDDEPMVPDSFEGLRKKLEVSEWMQKLLEEQLLTEKAKAQTASALNVDMENMRNALILKEEALAILENENSALDDQLHAEMDEFEQVRQALEDEIGGLRAGFVEAEAEHRGLEEQIEHLSSRAKAERAQLEEELADLKATLLLKDSALGRAKEETTRLLEERRAREESEEARAVTDLKHGGGAEGLEGRADLAEGPITPLTHSELQKVRSELARKDEVLMHLEMERGDLDSLVRNAVMKAESAERQKDEAEVALGSAAEAAEAAERQLDEAMGALAKDEAIITEMESKAQSLSNALEHKEEIIVQLTAELQSSKFVRGEGPGTPEPEHSQALRDLTNTCQEKLQEVEKELQQARERAVSTPSACSSASFPVDSSPTAVLETPHSRTRPAGLDALLTQGVPMIKHGRRGRPHERIFWCTPGLDKVCWGLSRTDPYARSVRVAQMTDVVEGRVTKGALRAPAAAADCLFSLRGIRDLDLQVIPEEEGLSRADLVETFRWVVTAGQRGGQTPSKTPRAVSPTSPFARLRHSIV